LNHYASPEFWRQYNELPVSVRELANRSFALLKSDPRHPSLRLKKVGKLYSARVGLHYRALATEVTDGLLWYWIGSHADYDATLSA
jgi:hypothetical protein